MLNAFSADLSTINQRLATLHLRCAIGLGGGSETAVPSWRNFGFRDPNFSPFLEKRVYNPTGCLASNPRGTLGVGCQRGAQRREGLFGEVVSSRSPAITAKV